MQRRHAHRTRRQARTVAGILPTDLYDYIGEEVAAPLTCKLPASRCPIEPITPNWTVSDDWPERVPVTDAEIDLFEAWFGDIIDELFGKSV